MTQTRDFLSDGGFEKKHGWDIAEQGASLNYFTSGVYGADVPRLQAFSERFGVAYAAPSEGAKAFYTEWDGARAHLSLSQTADLAKTVSDVLSFDYQAGWDLKSYNAKADRSFGVEVTDKDTGETKDVTVLVAHHGERVADTGLQHFSLDLSAFAGDQVEVSFVWDAPGTNDGPALFMLDNVGLLGTKDGHHEAAPEVIPDSHTDMATDHFVI